MTTVTLTLASRVCSLLTLGRMPPTEPPEGSNVDCVEKTRRGEWVAKLYETLPTNNHLPGCLCSHQVSGRGPVSPQSSFLYSLTHSPYPLSAPPPFTHRGVAIQGGAAVSATGVSEPHDEGCRSFKPAEQTLTAPGTSRHALRSFITFHYDHVFFPSCGIVLFCFFFTICSVSAVVFLFTIEVL
ncbi:hypothetical protein E2C01_032246 [Portunus trituberculatus]|uniref:Uncharacterized protein n=1 Tax=Portunus trituberculatus TaxID=210409 RepID=A0A5B7F2A5_PORTR|nr:hypothetical protein [Portunus trituberculatus]